MIGSRFLRSAGLFWLLAVSALAAPVPGREEFRRTFQKTLPLSPGQTLQVDHSHGDLRIRTHTEPQVKIDATIRVSSSDEEGAQKFSNDIEVTAEPTSGGVIVRTAIVFVPEVNAP